MTPHILRVGTRLQYSGLPPSCLTESLQPIIKEIGALLKAGMQT